MHFLSISKMELTNQMPSDTTSFGSFSMIVFLSFFFCNRITVNLQKAKNGDLRRDLPTSTLANPI
jgi:hypothetical protein